MLRFLAVSVLVALPFVPIPSIAQLSGAGEMPVAIDSCQAYLDDQYEATVGITFHAETQAASAVAFVFGAQDPFGSVSEWFTGTTTGTFSPGVKIEPKRPAMNPNVFQSRSIIPQNPAWSFSITPSASPQNIRCAVYKVRLADGSLWVNPNLTNIYPLSAMQ